MDTNNTDKMVATTEWMAKAYQRMNQELFNGELGDCDFGVFTTGKGSQGGTLGWFKISNRNVRVDRYSRRMLVRNGWGERTDIDASNFDRLCRPKIELNGNYTATEEALLGTLVHEMCHYYTYMRGICPKRGHGPEFYAIGRRVAAASNGRFTIQRLATAEEMSQYELSAEMQAKRDTRLANKKAKVSAVFVFTESGKVEMTITSNEGVIDEILQCGKARKSSDRKPLKIIRSNDAELIDMLFQNGYKRNMRAYRYWNVEDKPWINTLASYDYQTIYANGSESNVKVDKPSDKLNIPKVSKKLMFKLSLANGDTFEVEVPPSYFSLKKMVKERFPNIKDDIIDKVLNNPKNYYEKMNESKDIKAIVENVVNNFLQEEFEDRYISIDPEMNLGLESPLEEFN